MRNKLLLLLAVGVLLKVALLVSGAYKISYALSHVRSTEVNSTKVALTPAPKDTVADQPATKQAQSTETTATEPSSPATQLKNYTAKSQQPFRNRATAGGTERLCIARQHGELVLDLRWQPVALHNLWSMFLVHSLV